MEERMKKLLSLLGVVGYALLAVSIVRDVSKRFEKSCERKKGKK